MEHLFIPVFKRKWRVLDLSVQLTLVFQYYSSFRFQKKTTKCTTFLLCYSSKYRKTSKTSSWTSYFLRSMDGLFFEMGLFSQWLVFNMTFFQDGLFSRWLVFKMACFQDGLFSRSLLQSIQEWLFLKWLMEVPNLWLLNTLETIFNIELALTYKLLVGTLLHQF